MDKCSYFGQIPEFIPLKREIFRKFHLPFSPGTVLVHRSKGGPLRSYTIRDRASGRVLFHLAKWLADVRRQAERQGNREGGNGCGS